LTQPVHQVQLTYSLESRCKMPVIVTRGLGNDGGSSFVSTGLVSFPDRLEITFNLGVAPLTLLASVPSNWTIANINLLSTPITVNSLGVSGNVVTLHTTEGKGGDSYNLTVPLTGLQSTTSVPYSGSAVLNFTANALSPVASFAQAIDARHVRIVFSEPVVGADATNIGNYSITNSLNVISVQQESSTSYVLYTSQQTSGTSYSITVYNVRDLAGNPV
jgi:hypothetical protein